MPGDIKYNASKLFKAAFGINSPIFITQPIGKKEAPNVSFKDVQVLPDYYKAEATSWMGTPIIGLLTFKAGTYKIYTDQGKMENITLSNFVLPATTLFSFRRAKNITKTNLLGNNGTVKEIFGFDDWIIDVKGIALDSPTMSARDQLIEMKIWEELADAIQISGKLFNSKKISAITIDDYKEEGLQGKPGVIPFSMTLTSDEAIELILPETDLNF